MTYAVDRRTLLRGLAGVFASSLMAACGPSRRDDPIETQRGTVDASGTQASPPAHENLRVAFWSQPLAEQANVYAAQEYGWFRDEGVGFEFVPGAGGGDAVRQIIAGNADLAFANLEPMFFALDQGAKLRAVYNIYPENVFNVISVQGQGMTQPEHLRGKKVGVYSLASGTYHNLLVILRAVGLRETDLEIVATGVNNFGPLLEGQVDAQAATDTGLFLAQQQGLGDVDVIWARDYLNTPTDAFIVTEETYQDRKEVIRRFLRAYKRGSQWMLDHPGEAAELVQKHVTDGQDISRNLDIIKLRNASTLNADTRAHGLGWFNLDVLRQVEQALFDLGLIKNPITVDSVFTNEFIQDL